ncbi:hypothetical protein [Poseidonocella sp. HB161398]|uniref:hypothetical protein n=1 Tax=Poseidonocella sp. HB161398 TaxID=2320855 RepID=UPI0011099BFA|nr:hypothetical protein [Poseidonocella sp. HB161398]
MTTEPDPRERAEQIKALNTLQRTRGWRVLCDVMQAEIQTVMQQLASPGPVTPDDIHYKRGQLHAAISLLSLPEKLASKLESEDAFEKRVAQTKEPPHASHQ